MPAEREPISQREAFQQALEALGPGPEHPCAYRPGYLARNVALRIAHLPPGVYHALMDLNFRRCGSVFYRPACGRCRECRALRVEVEMFRPNRSQQRCWRRNQDLAVDVGDAVPTEEKHALFQRYLQRRHDQEMSNSWRDFCAFLYDSPIKTAEVVYRLDRRIVSVGIFDVEPQAVSTVYCYFDPDLAQRSLGMLNVLWTIRYCRRQRVPYLYLGYYIHDCHKMNYKADFRPCEILGADNHWHVGRL